MKDGVLTYSDAQTVCKGILVRPDITNTRSPGILLVHDIRGVGLNPRAHIDKLVALGYVVLVADMFGDGTAPSDFEQGRRLIAAVQGPVESWRKRVHSALTALTALPDVDATRIAAVGYCFGGSTILELALSGAPIRAAVSLHGSLDCLSLQDAHQVSARLLVCTGAEDPLIPADSVLAFQTAMRSGGVKDWQVLTLSQAKHSYTNTHAPRSPTTGYDERADRRSLAAMVAFLADTLQ